jgi:hypothetical protein
MDSVTFCLVGGWIAFHGAALVLAWATRLSGGSKLESIMQLAFFAAMVAIASAIWISRKHSDNAWMASAITLVAMVVTAVVDFQRLGDHRRAVAEASGR